ncbi:MAG TPA: Wzz/FepE/Etk N-terminal domain-containing protein [Bryobacteraceae bacterium]|nr:Wzz/FepE/Etk N-terminal domain-containing protein [Bryobacteraceae bacterium]
MQPQNPLARQPRPLDLEDYIDIVRRHKAWILGPVFAALVASTVLAFLWPDTYVSVTTIRVVPPQVPESFVPANVSLDLQGRVNSLVQLILNRATLTDIINTHGLYRKELARQPLEDVIETMRSRDLKVVPMPQSLNQIQDQQHPQYPAFEIRFAYNNRFTAQKVTTDLVARFLEENVREMSQQTVSTTQFLRDQWDEAKKKLDGLEQKLSVFRSQNMGRLPEEQQSNVQQLTALESQRLNLNLSMNRVNQERLLNENQLRIYREQLASLKDPNAPEAAVQQKNDKLVEKDREISQYEDSLAAARQRYKETHPDVQRLTGLLALARQQREAIAIQDEAMKPEPPPPRPASPQLVREQRELAALIERTQGLMQAKDLEMDDYRKQAAQLDTTIKSYQARLESGPLGIKEYDELIRDRDLAKKEYEELDRRLNTSAMATALENRQAGERLEQLDPPSLPQTPTEPQRPLIISLGTSLGLLIGLCLTGTRELKDTALKNLKDVRACAELPILAAVPLLENDRAVRRRKRLMWLAWSAVCLAGVAVMSSSVVYHYASKL